MAAEARIHEPAVAQPSPTAQWSARAFGIDLDLRFEAPALRQARTTPAAGATVLELISDAEIDERWRAAEAAPLGWMPDAQGNPLLTITRHPELGILFTAKAHGRYVIDADARHVACAPAAAPDWHWQRIMVGQILPLVAALRGLYVIHASAIALGDRAIAISGPPGAGKSTLALELASRGHRLLAEDVVALRLKDGRVLAEPGVALVNLRPSASAERAIAKGSLRVLGRSHKIHVDLPRERRPLPLSALYLLEPAQPGRALVESLAAPSLPELMGTAFVPYLTRPEDLVRHLEVSAAITRTATVARAHVDPADGPVALADALETHAANVPLPCDHD